MARAKDAWRLVQQLPRPHAGSRSVITLDTRHCIAMGHLFAERPRRYGSLVKMAGSVNDAQIAFGAIPIGPPSYTENKNHFEIIRNVLKALKVESV